MFDKKYQGLLTSFFMAFAMSAVMSLIVTIRNFGFNDDLINQWLQSPL